MVPGESQLQRGLSVEELVCGNAGLPADGTHTSVSLNSVLFSLFEEGWDPDNFGLHHLESATVLWLKGLDLVPDVVKQAMPEVVTGALQVFAKMKDSSKRLEKAKEVSTNTCNAASKTAEVKFQSFLSGIVETSSDQEHATVLLQQRKKVLESWVQKCHQEAQSSVETIEKQHGEVRDELSTVVKGLVRASHCEFKDNIAKAADATLDDAEQDELMKELDAELAKFTMGSDQDDQHQLVPAADNTIKADQANDGNNGMKDQDMPSGTVTEAYMKMKEAIDAVAAQSNIPEEIREALVGSVHQCVKKALDPSEEEEQEKQPEKKPEGKEPEVPGKNSQEPAGPEPSKAEAVEVPDPGASVVAEEPKGGAATVRAVEAVLQRQDTSQMRRGDTSDLEAEELEKCKVILEDGSVRYQTKRGKLETLEEREKRLGHNSYMQFSRSFESSLVLWYLIFNIFQLNESLLHRWFWEMINRF